MIFLNSEEQIQELKTTQLACVSLPQKWQSFKAVVVTGEALELYLNQDPVYGDETYKVNLVSVEQVRLAGAKQ